MPRGKHERANHLRGSGLFSACSDRELHRIERAGTELSIGAGDTLIEEGTLGNEAFVVLDGTVTVRRNGRKVATLGPGSVLGELALLDRGPRTATVTADTDGTVFVMDQRSFMGVLDDVPAIAHKLLASLATRIRELDRQYYG
jgi:CRP/FNR family transcriptional regulator, cyclic AMP receptor protein